MGFFDALDVSASGLTAERLRMDTIANNLANANSVKGADGKPFQRQVVELGARGAQGGGTGGGSFASFGGFQQAASGGGVQALSNVNPVTEMVDLITATRGYEADTTAIKAVEGMAQHAMDVIR
jgi:flagellar basal-body rod protein FlgC